MIYFCIRGAHIPGVFGGGIICILLVFQCFRYFVYFKEGSRQNNLSKVVPEANFASLAVDNGDAVTPQVSRNKLVLFEFTNKGGNCSNKVIFLLPIKLSNSETTYF